MIGNQLRHGDVEGESQDGLLVRIMEEAVEVQAALGEIAKSASKMLRFGVDGNHPTYYNGLTNVEYFNTLLDPLMDEYNQFWEMIKAFGQTLDGEIPKSSGYHI